MKNNTVRITIMEAAIIKLNPIHCLLAINTHHWATLKLIIGLCARLSDSKVKTFKEIGLEASKPFSEGKNLKLTFCNYVLYV